MKIFFAGILCAAATALVAISLRHHEDANAQRANHTAQKWLLPRSAAAPATIGTVGNGPVAAPTVSPNWIIKHHGFCCEGNLAAQGPSTYVLLPVLDVGNKIDRSDDGGITWTRTYPPADVSVPFGIEGDLQAFGDDAIYFGTLVAQGVAAHSDNRGASWTTVPIAVAFPANDQAWSYLGPFSNMRPGAPLPTDEPYVLAGWYRIGSVALFSFDGGLTWPIQTPLVGDDGSGPDHIVCHQMAHDPMPPGDTRIPDTNFISHKSGRHGTWGTDKKFYWTDTASGSLYVCKTDNFGATWTGIKHPIVAGGVVTYSGFDNRGTLYVLHDDNLYVSFNQGESFAFVHTLPRLANGEAADGANEFFVANCGTIHIGLIEAGTGGDNVWYLRGSNVDTASPTWDQEFVDVVGLNRLDFMQIVINGNGIPTISYTDSGGAVTTASRDTPMPGDTSCGIIPVSVVSRKIHGSAGAFDINLPLTGTRGVECRSGGATGDYTVVFTFPNNITNCGTAGAAGGSVSSGPNPNQCTENLTGVSNAQYITVTLNGVVDSTTGNVGNVSGTMGVLVGDVNATGLVDGNDVSAVQGQARQTANSTNFRLDVNTTGLIDGNDVSLVQSKTRSSLPTPP